MATIEREIWVARDRYYYDLFAYTHEPILKGNDYYPSPLDKTYTTIALDSSLFPEVTFETGPKKYKITIEEI